MKRKLGKVLANVLVSVLGLFALLYFGGITAQLLENYQAWMDAGGMIGQARMG